MAESQNTSYGLTLLSTLGGVVIGGAITFFGAIYSDASRAKEQCESVRSNMIGAVSASQSVIEALEAQGWREELGLLANKDHREEGGRRWLLPEPPLEKVLDRYRDLDLGSLPSPLPQTVGEFFGKGYMLASEIKLLTGDLIRVAAGDEKKKTINLHFTTLSEWKERARRTAVELNSTHCSLNFFS